MQVLGYRLDNWGSISSRGNDGIFSHHHCIQHWGPPSLLSNVYWDKAAKAWSWPLTSIYY